MRWNGKHAAALPRGSETRRPRHGRERMSGATERAGRLTRVLRGRTELRILYG